MVLAGPEIHAHLYDHASLFVHALLGGAHTGGAQGVTPNVSFAGGLGLGVEYSFTRHFAVRAYGDDIYSSFAIDPQHLGYSPHKRGNARASVGVAYRF